MLVTLGQQYNVAEKRAPLYCTLTLTAMQGHQTKTNQKQRSTAFNMVVIIYCYIGYEDKATTSRCYLNGFPDGSNHG